MRALLPVGEGRLHAAGLDALQPLSQQATVATHVVPAELAVVAAAAALVEVVAAAAATVVDVDAPVKRYRRDPRPSEGRPSRRGSGPQRPRDRQHRVGELSEFQGNVY